eukprot:1183426-Prorocentrum_minimum.AAC.4
MLRAGCGERGPRRGGREGGGEGEEGGEGGGIDEKELHSRRHAVDLRAAPEVHGRRAEGEQRRGARCGPRDPHPALLRQPADSTGADGAGEGHGPAP